MEVAVAMGGTNGVVRAGGGLVVGVLVGDGEVSSDNAFPLVVARGLVVSGFDPEPHTTIATIGTNDAAPAMRTLVRTFDRFATSNSLRRAAFCHQSEVG